MEIHNLQNIQKKGFHQILIIQTLKFDLLQIDNFFLKNLNRIQLLNKIQINNQITTQLNIQILLNNRNLIN